MPQAITQAAVHGLSPFTKYSVRVLAVYADGSVGVSDSSMEVSTLEAPPTMPPSGLTAAVTEDNTGLNLFWEVRTVHVHMPYNIIMMKMWVPEVYKIL